ncbi:MAG: ATP-binding protein [Verrucomicrobiota bacterium]
MPLREEMDFLDHYLAIEQIRFGDRLRIEKQIEPPLMAAQVPVLILQPLVENAIKHGIEKKLGPGVVTITASSTDKTLLLQVRDNGRGLQTTIGGQVSEGVGLSNIRARLRELAGDAASLQINSPAEGGFVAEIRLPWRTIPSRASQA